MVIKYRWNMCAKSIMREKENVHTWWCEYVCWWKDTYIKMDSFIHSHNWINWGYYDKVHDMCASYTTNMCPSFLSNPRTRVYLLFLSFRRSMLYGVFGIGFIWLKRTKPNKTPTRPAQNSVNTVDMDIARIQYIYSH